MAPKIKNYIFNSSKKKKRPKKREMIEKVKDNQFLKISKASNLRFTKIINPSYIHFLLTLNLASKVISNDEQI